MAIYVVTDVKFIFFIFVCVCVEKEENGFKL